MIQGPTRVKICGLTSPEAIKGAAQAGATYGGLVFYEKSPRHLSLAKAREVALAAPSGFAKVALVVNPQDAFLEEMLSQVPIDILQLHGAEQPQRVQQIKQSTGLPIMKALGIATAQDLHKIDRYAEICDQLLIDAKPAPGAKLPGGNGLAFDWQLLENHTWKIPWMLAGGLTPDNVAQAIRVTQARQIDVSSGVESAPGLKDMDKMRNFVAQARL
ncbi:phosphoribosylanthranilate isomerase [Rhodobacterales bacterium FZCC0083]|nr:phosphoribosylanthranilate isomerase [Rhodobacterales bacterium FZCC0083]